MNFGEVFTRAWKIIWTQKVLWIFGLLAGLAASGDTGNSGVRLNFQSDGRSILTGPGGPFTNIPAWAVLLLILLGMALLLVAILLGTLGRAGLMRGAWLADSGETGLTFNHLFRESRAYFWRVLALEIVLVGLGLTLLLILGTPVLAAGGLALFCLWPLFCLLVPLFLLLSIIGKLAVAGITGENLGVVESIQRAWVMARANLGQVIAVGLALIIGSFVVGSIAALPAMAILGPLVIGIYRGASSGLALGGGLLLLVLFVLYLPVLLAVNGLVATYVDTVWTLTYRRLSAGHSPSTT